MTSSPNRIDEIFWGALQLASEEERRTYLDRACGPDQHLRQLVEKLLRAQPKAAAFLEQPFTGPQATVDEAIIERPGTVIGPYKLMEQIGEGGMGLVFVAEQKQPLRRQVALKVIKPGMDTRQVVARFEAERQALALMDHPNIAKVHDGGETASGRPFFVMELVKGEPITEYCDQNQVPIRERLKLFLDACAAVQHAHQKGIIHRDIKPSNVLVMSNDGTPLVKVIDFGIAKAVGQQLTDKTIYTQFTQLVGTPLYMSPEQAGQSGMDVDTRTDIYALGVLLHELLTGTTPFDKERFKDAAYDEIRRVIREEEPPKPSTRISTLGQTATTISTQRKSEPKQLSRLLRGELDWIVMKALEKDRNLRYETASALAADVQRYLHDEPVQACPPSALYRFRKFARRYRVPLVMATLSATMLVLAVVGLVVSNLLITRQRDVAQTQRRLARNAVDKMFTQVAEQWLAHRAGLEPLQRDFLEEALHFYQDLAEEVNADPEVRLETANAYRRVGEIYDRLGWSHRGAEVFNRRQENNDEIRLFDETGETSKTVDAFQRALALLEPLATEFPSEPRFREGLARALEGYASALLNVGRRSEAVRAQRRAVQLWVELVDQSPGVPTCQQELARSYNKLGIALFESGQSKSSAEACRKARQLFEALPANIANLPVCRSELCSSVLNLYFALARLDRRQEAEKTIYQAVALHEKLVSDFPYEPSYQYDLGMAHYRLGCCIADTRPAEAEVALRKAMSIGEQVMIHSPSVATYRGLPQEATQTLAFLVRRQGRLQEGVELLQRAMGILEKLAAETNDPAYPQHLAWTYKERGQLYGGEQHEKAQADFRRALEIYTEFLNTHPNQAGDWAGRSGIYVLLGDWDRATADLSKAIQISPDQWWLRQGRCSNYIRLHQYEQALADASKGIELNDKVWRLWQLRGDAYAGLQQQEKARADYARAEELKAEAGKEAFEECKEAIAVLPKAVADFNRAEDRWQLGYRYGVFAGLLKKLGQPQKSETARREALAVWQKLVADYPEVADYRWHLARNHHELGAVLRDTGRRAEAEQAHREALVHWEKLASDYPRNTDYFYHLCSSCDLADILQQDGQQAQAQDAWRQSLVALNKWLQVNPKNAVHRNQLAWLLATHAEPGFGNPGRAVELAKEAVTLTPKNALYWNTLGVAHYRAGDWKEAIEALTKSMELERGALESFDTFFLAMAHWRLGEKAKARQWYDKAVQWMEKNDPDNGELRRFRAEAGELLQTKEKDK
jgi:serine/threonine protein kinase/Flp pilus assembly protein TadD